MKKKDNFKGQQMLVLPQIAIETLKNNTLTQNLYLTDIGYFPEARNHFRERKQGCSENILFLCTDGKGWIECAGGKFELRKNQYYILPKNRPHTYYADHQDPWTIFWIHFNGHQDHHFIQEGRLPQAIPEADNARFEDRLVLFREIMILLDDFAVNNLVYSSILLQHLLGSLRYLDQFRKSKEKQNNDNISRAKTYMKDHLHKKLSLEEIARHTGLSLSHFCLLFKQQTTYTPVEYLTMLRIQKACKLLSLSRQKINEIAGEVGYEDAYYFSRVFKKMMGQSPREYRLHLKG
jgi:AraC-like DNA-binding protein/mannose-6-phosphate isomerase-like protein (cupin superfamily)